MLKTRLTIAAAMFTFASGLAMAQAAPTKEQINEQYQAAKKQCDTMRDNAKKICEAEAEGQKDVAEAQAKLSARDTPKARLELAEAKYDAAYEVAKERCGDEVGDAKKSCEDVAKAQRDLDKAQAKRQSIIDGAAKK